jgi:hypothetical protein
MPLTKVDDGVLGAIDDCGQTMFFAAQQDVPNQFAMQRDQ